MSNSSRALTAVQGRDVTVPADPPSFGLALGGGGARGLAHVVMLEALDELGLKPKVIAGTSIGAVIGAAYASGMSAREIRAQMLELLTLRFDLVRDLFEARARNLPRASRLFSPINAFLSSEALLEIVFPSRVARDFSELKIPLRIIATDFYALEAVVFTQGPLRKAVAASMALPAIFEPVLVGTRALIDGGLTNPLPFDLVREGCDFTVAVDVSGAPVPAPNRDHPTASEALFAASFIFERTIIREKLKSQQPDILIQAGTHHFQLLDMLKVDEILAAAEPAKEEFKTKLRRLMGAETLPDADLDGTRLSAAATAPADMLPAPARLPRLMHRFRLRKRTRRPQV